MLLLLSPNQQILLYRATMLHSTAGQANWHLRAKSDRKLTDFISSQSSPTENPVEKIIERIISCSYFLKKANPIRPWSCGI